MIGRFAATVLAALVFAPAPALARDALPAGFVFLRDIDPTIAQDIRYASANNFTGRPLPGYAGGECVLKREAALALAKVQAELARVAHDPEKWEPVFGKGHAPKENFGLKVYDCYRPARATRAMLRWASEPESGATKRFYPALDKRTLFSGYISGYSLHATGIAVDLTLVKLPPAAGAAFDPAARYGACTAPASARAPDNSLDMGTGFDCFDGKSSSFASNISADAAHARTLLFAAMRKQGFRNYFREWWHFSYGPAPAQHYDFEIPGR